MAFATGLPSDFCERAELLALRWRTRLGLTEREPLDPYDLAELMEVEVMPMAAVPGFAAHHRLELQREDSKSLSAITVLRGERKLIVVNESHTTERQVNSLAHELSHILLEHPPSTALDVLGNRIFPQRLEDEADWLAACLLVPASGLETALAVHHGRAAAAAYYGVSIELMRWRCNSQGLGYRAA